MVRSIIFIHMIDFGRTFDDVIGLVNDEILRADTLAYIYLFIVVLVKRTGRRLLLSAVGPVVEFAWLRLHYIRGCTRDG